MPTDRWGLTPGDWRVINQVANTNPPGEVTTTRIARAITAMHDEINATRAVFDQAGTIGSTDPTVDLNLSTRAILMHHQLKEARILRDIASRENVRLIERFAEWIDRESMTLFDTSNQPLDPVDHPEVAIDGDLIGRFLAEYGMPQPPDTGPRVEALGNLIGTCEGLIDAFEHKDPWTPAARRNAIGALHSAIQRIKESEGWHD